MATLGHAARVPRADHRGGVVVAPLPPRKTQVSVLPGRLEPVRTHGRVALVLDSSSAASNLVGNEPGAILLVKEEQAGSVLVDRVASAAAEQEVGAEAALLVGNGLRVLCVQLNLPTVAQTKVGRLSSTQKTERLTLLSEGNSDLADLLLLQRRRHIFHSGRRSERWSRTPPCHTAKMDTCTFHC